MTAKEAAVGLFLTCAACAHHGRIPDRLTAPASDGDARLSDSVVPTAYHLELTVDPSQPTFSGAVWISVQLQAATEVIRLHAKDLDVRTAAVARRGGESVTAVPVAGQNGGLALAVSTPLPPDEYVIHMTFAGRFADGLVGLYRVQVADAFYAFTQFEALHARQAFPCFDEPRFKTPWEITLHVPHDLVVASNAPISAVSQNGTFDLVRFATSEPLPTYLVALVVGPFDVVEMPGGAVPLRALTVSGEGNVAVYVLLRAPQILAFLADYFGRPYPYQKLDFVAVPALAAEAMENAGLVTFRDDLVLIDAERASATERYHCESALAHELAHQWFGNLVTMVWWDDLWLNEGFATWMATKVLMQTAPEFHANLDAVDDANRAMQADALEAARAVRQPITGSGDVVNAFDDITYQKGAAILRMLETWVGEERFRAGVRAYINAHAWGSVRTADLFAALGRATAQPVAEVAATFLDQPGTPLLALTTACDGGTPIVHLAQSRYLPAGSHASSGRPWHMPVCFRYGSDDTSHSQCTVLATTRAEIGIEAAACPSWIQPSADGTGYYRWRLPEPQLLALVADRQRLTAAEEVALPGNLDALLVAEELDAGTYLDALGQLAQSNQRQVVHPTIGGMQRIYHATVDYDGGVSADDLAVYVRRTLGQRAHGLGMVPRSDDEPETELLRAQIIPAVAAFGRDAALRAQAHELTARFLTDPHAVPDAAAQIAVPIAALDGDAALHRKLLGALTRAENPHDRATALSGLGSFRDPALFERSLQLYLTDDLRAGEFWALAGHAHDTQALQSVAFAWLTQNFDAVAAKLGDEGVSSLPFVGAGFCDQAGRDRVEHFFALPAHQRPGSARTLAQGLESIDQCMRLRARATDSVRNFLQRPAEGS